MFRSGQIFEHPYQKPREVSIQSYQFQNFCFSLRLDSDWLTGLQSPGHFKVLL